MNNVLPVEIDDKWILSKRGIKNTVDPERPYAWLVEKERTIRGAIEPIAVIFLTNKECPFHCLMCDLWKNTTDITVSAEAISLQIKFALRNIKNVRHIKLYNSGSFFDRRAIPVVEYKKIAELLETFETVIVESHSAFINESILEFKNMLKPELHVAMGLETVNPEVLDRLNKQMTLEDFKRAASFLNSNNIPSRAFILLRPPFMTEAEGIIWAKKSIDFAFQSDIECCTIIPVRGGNGAMETLQQSGHFHTPDIRSLEEVLEYGISLKKGRVFADTWDLSLFSSCNKCLDQRSKRLETMNHTQQFEKKISCDCRAEVSVIS